MKKVIYILFVCLFASTGLTYTYEVYTYEDNKTLIEQQSILVDLEGGMDRLTLYSGSSAEIKGTSLLSDGFGIRQIRLYDNSSLIMMGGEVHEIDVHSNATATLKGGLIESIYSYQIVPDPHITLYHSGAVPTVQDIGGFNYLVGQWGDGTDFSIYLHNTGYNVYGNFEFILVPEPASLTLLALGGLLISRQRLKV